MYSEIQSQIEGDFHGYDEGAIFKLTNGQVWQQKQYLYCYHYAYRPRILIFQDGSRNMLSVTGINKSVEVVRVNVLTEGYIVSDFRGFDQNMKFEFQNGQIWEQVESKYAYHNAYHPEAMIVDGINSIELYVEGMNRGVRVRRV